MKVSAILATYNEPKWLEKVIWGYAVQTHESFELVIADDGSTAETAETIKKLRNETGLIIKHVWHEDDGFRKCRILNKAIQAATSDYLVFSDGDCIPRNDFLEAHVRYATPRRFLSGGLVRLPMDVSHKISVDDIQEQKATDYAWLRGSGMSWNKKCVMLVKSKWQARLCDFLTTTRATWNGHNASGWKEDILEVNGFDERMGYGGEDREMGLRLMNKGIQPVQIRHRAVCVHLDHKRGYVHKAILAWNKQHRQKVSRMRMTWTNYGIAGQEDTSSGMILQFPGQPITPVDTDAEPAVASDSSNMVVSFPTQEEKQPTRKAA
ncbi:glycosyltransferase family 2 protein [Adhaeretor mobilis]|uniref:Chondroitin synthase n=1 Tax=Adhaeretor mobilis TaxID=1930276 RepID=A0A517MPQ5_9BACT|nr:glycosyltransferase family 2 protein [Adhaeretor mobilis]QDS96868.1 Chondroitin synthase [Adhaeretor mobilis]